MGKGGNGQPAKAKANATTAGCGMWEGVEVRDGAPMAFRPPYFALKAKAVKSNAAVAAAAAAVVAAAGAACRPASAACSALCR